MFDKFTVMVFMILVVTFFLLIFIAIYNRRRSEQRIRGRFDLNSPIGGSNLRRRGLDEEIVETFPTFIYSTVKSLKIGMATLQCAVCINEFQDDETLRLIPVCNHVFHPECIDAWLAHHSTCPVCRANLSPTNDEEIAIEIRNHTEPEPEPNPVQADEDNNDSVREASVIQESPKLNTNNSVHQNRSPISRVKGFSFKNLFPRSNTTGHSLVQLGENFERFTLRLPEEVKNKLVMTKLRTAKSWHVALTPEGSEKRVRRTRSINTGRGRSYMERFARSDRKGFSPRGKDGSTGSTKGTDESNKEVGERSFDQLVPKK
ncbi:hypothetical protein TanjilG_12632 [Lupinus angustifolius]|uniref:RING-type E3 ubiquitin transferase n=1 Tax=Lupinus angustifolius TaxID=3871 RepID=A0A4P1QYT6_LUPAN|nr:PREDICTED: RING-H2 finger protein ATL11-like [Lupinus angustifolius]OIV97875.1 hypothetical protein TanjilG_12632 [Lupinus angustifolius]